MRQKRPTRCPGFMALAMGTTLSLEGFTGDACFAQGCERPFHDNGCGGMDEQRIQ